ncbi:hypothetical protein CRE_05020 [Caenorhabditis remanei]|uniref:C-type lectin domain-containing protein n=1 Tax=Caenorhabditis remanei TaxID=31234 RepID=E3MZ21_CAERE|nr:hypothetical protein CRE_05020 [Caenorhabditis remanei]
MIHLILLFLVCTNFSLVYSSTSCVTGYTLVNQKCWMLVSQTADEPTADEYCRLNGGGVIATLKNAIDNRGLLTILNGTSVSRLWIGMICTGLSPSTCRWADTTTVQYTSFSSGNLDFMIRELTLQTLGFPNDRFGQCVYYSADGYPAGQWASGPCEEQLPFVCELPTTSPDVTGDCLDYANYNNYCYMKEEDVQSFSWAQKDCARHNANLVSIHSYLENRFITSLFQEGKMDLWIGALAPGSALIVWTDGTPNNYYNLKNSGNGSCVSMGFDPNTNSTGDWSSGDCEAEYPSLCKRPNQSS